MECRAETCECFRDGIGCHDHVCGCLAECANPNEPYIYRVDAIAEARRRALDEALRAITGPSEPSEGMTEHTTYTALEPTADTIPEQNPDTASEHKPDTYPTHTADIVPEHKPEVASEHKPEIAPEHTSDTYPAHGTVLATNMPFHVPTRDLSIASSASSWDQAFAFTS